MAARRARRGHVYRRRSKSGGWTSWYAVIDLDRGEDGRRRQRSKSFATRAQAHDWLTQVQAQNTSEGPTLGRWLTEWLGRAKDLRPSTRQSYTGHVANYLVPLLGDTPLAALGTAEVSALHEMLAAAPSATFHWLRHYYASLLIRYGESVKTVQARLGHATAAETLDTYGHLLPDSDDRTRQAASTALLVPESTAETEGTTGGQRASDTPA